ncbi:GNAT family protein [Streptomyces sp. NPDC006333]|uniref:GNAT family N-acetyltransferase n=1 Tax=Streptomyces sp. NPDC006333 TaxID=3156753 RepID=UPI0033B185FE
MTWDDLPDTVLTNDRVELRRIRVTDRAEFERIVYGEEIWRHFVTRIETPADLNTFLETAIKDTLTGVRIVFAVVDRHSGHIVGSSAYGNLARADRRLEIGWSWVATALRGTGANRAAKLALLDHAFDVLGCERVEFKTDVLNTVARRGLAALGATEEGTLRSYNYMPGGRRRDVVYYSILRNEWPVLRAERFAPLAVGTGE